MELAKKISGVLVAVALVLAILYVKVWMVATGISMILGVPVKLFPVALIVFGLGIRLGGSSD